MIFDLARRRWYPSLSLLQIFSGTFSWAVSFFRVHCEMREKPPSFDEYSLVTLAVGVSGIEMMPTWSVRVFEHSGDAKLALNY